MTRTAAGANDLATSANDPNPARYEPSEVRPVPSPQLPHAQTRDCRFEYGMLIGHPPRLEQDGTIVTRYSHIDVELAGMPAEEVELRTFGNGHYHGRFMLTPTPGSKPTLQARLVAVTQAPGLRLQEPRHAAPVPAPGHHRPSRARHAPWPVLTRPRQRLQGWPHAH